MNPHVFLIILGLSGHPDTALTFYNSTGGCAGAQRNLTSGRWVGTPVRAECRDTMAGLEWFVR